MTDPFQQFKPIEKIKADNEKAKRELEKFDKEKEKLEKREKAEIKEAKLEIKEGKREVKENKLELKEVKGDKVEVKENKSEIKEFKNEKIEVEDFRVGPKGVKEDEGPLVPGELRTQPALDREMLLRHAEALESMGRELRHFIEAGDRPDLSRGALRDEPDQQGETTDGDS